jgi:hypothetical protein
MAWTLANPDRLFDRTWRPRHPLRPRLSLARRRCMLSILVVLCAVIFGYGWLTDAKRVRAMAEIYLSDLLGGDVEIRRASLSIFEGLRLDDVTVRVEGPSRPDATVFHAQTLLIKYNPAELLAGKISGTQIVAIDPTVLLVEDAQTHRWNYQRLWHGKGVPPRHDSSVANGPPVLPQIILRDAQVAYVEMNGTRLRTVGWYSLEGSLSPGESPDEYDFELQSRGRESIGPSVEGTIRTDGGASVARLHNFTFGPDVKTMLIAEVRQWCERHQLEGRIDVPEMYFAPGKPGEKPSYRVEISLSSVELAVSPEEWMSRRQLQNLQTFHGMLDSVVPGKWITPDVIDSFRRLSTPQPIHLRQVSGTLVFTEGGLQLNSINGRLENNWFDLDGTIDGYTPDAPATLTISSMPGHDLEFPAWSPTYAGSLPPEVQEIYERLHPQGTCSVSVSLNRGEAGGRPVVAGQIDIHNGQFKFADFPYPLSGATGTIVIGHDPLAGMDGIRVMDIRGHGPDDGPNANSTVSINGFIGPLDQVAGVWLDLRADNITSDPIIRSALPPPVDRALRLFDPTGTGDLPQFRGDVYCRIRRPVGSHKRWTFDTDVNLADAAGTLIFFPYPMKHISGQLLVRDHYMDLVNIAMRRGNTSLDINGKVTWKSDHGPKTNTPVGPDLTVVAKNLPLDDDLKSALPPAERDWLISSGAAGLLEVTGRVLPGKSDSNPLHPDVDFVFNAHLHDGSLWPKGDQYALSHLGAQLLITPTSFVLTDMKAKSGSGDIAGQLAIHWTPPPQDGTPAPPPELTVSATAKNVPLTDALYAAMPLAARQAWDQINPQGTVDATIDFAAALNSLSGVPDPNEKLDLQIKPSVLAIKPRMLPYQLEDVHGLVSVSPTQMTLDKITAHHGTTAVVVSGHGDLGDHPQWTLKVLADPLPLDADAIAAAPDTVAQIIKALKLTGTVGLNVSKIAYRPAIGDATGPDIDFAAKVTLEGAALNVGIPVDGAVGTMDVAGLVRDGKLHRLGVQLAADKLTFAGRPASKFTATITKPTDDPVVVISRFGGSVAGGDLDGSGQFSYSDDNDSATPAALTTPGRYDFSVVLRDADLAQLAAPQGQGMNGRLAASLDMDGTLGDPNSRRGHGNVTVAGDDMYHLPILLGLLQMTDLALPLNSPFSEASTRYSIDGQQVVFDEITLKSKQMAMTGNGQMDFGAKTVSLWFVTDNPTLVSLPVVGPFIHGAKQELLKIHVSGTIQEPKVSASSFNTITTTVDRVLGDDDDGN